MANKKLWLGMLVLVLTFGMTVVGCDLSEEEDFAGTINGVWHHVDDNKNKTGSIITINGNVGTLTAIGAADIFKEYSDSGQMNIGDTVLRNINFQGEWEGLSGNKDTIYWDCEFIIPWVISYLPALKWSKTYISYNKKESYMFIFTMGNPNFGQGYRFRK